MSSSSKVFLTLLLAAALTAFAVFWKLQSSIDVNGNYYEVLGVEPAADIAEIKKAYRHLSLKYHPDKNPGNKAAESMQQKIAEAYTTLQSPELRQRYDEVGSYPSLF